jgi:type I restriction enzyme S subunit
VSRQRLLMGEALSVLIDHRGKTPKKLGGDWTSSGHRVISALNIKDSRVDSNDHHYVSDEIYTKWMKEPLQAGDVLLTSEAPTGEVAYLADDADWCIGQRIFALRGRPDVLDGRYLFYLLRGGEVRHQLLARATGTTVSGIRQAELVQVELDLPPIEDQRRIAATLGSLDDKIESNRQTVETLDRLAQAIFRASFVDFTPHSGVKPTGWRDGTLSEIVSTARGGDWGKESAVGDHTQDVYCIRGTDIPDINAGKMGKMPVRYINQKNYGAKQLIVGDVVVEISGGSPTQSTGRSALISQPLLSRYSRGMVCTNFCRAIKPVSGYSIFFYFYWRYLYDQDVMFTYENGTTSVKNLDLTSVLEVEPIVIPPIEVAAQFADRVDSLIGKVFACGLESERLMKLRDALLPELLSGRIRVPEPAAEVFA